MTGYWVVFCLLACGELLVRVNTEVATVVCGGKDCQNGALKCTAANECECLEGWTGDVCTEVEGCTGSLLTICDDLSLECIYDRSQSKAICKCLLEYEIFNGTHCKECDCGEHGDCSFGENDKKTCDCKPMFAEKHGICLDCECGEEAKSCQFNNDVKACNCNSKYADNNGICSACDCKGDGICTFDVTGALTCVCDQGFAKTKDGFCYQCDCGVNGACSFDESNNPICDCAKGYNVNSNNICQECDCGENGKCIIDESNNPICECESGFNVNSKNKCQACDCKGDGTCTFDVTDELTCVCDQGFAKMKDGLCYHCDCGTHGYCYFDPADTKYCMCEIGYTANELGYCEEPCFSSPCKNDGVCIVVNSTDYICQCKKPFSGNHCERHPCHSNPCLNDGACIAVENNYGCVCDEPFYGRHCENDPCTPSPCKNAGLCEVVGIDFNCTCKASYFGKQCEIEIDTTEAISDSTINDLITTGPVTTNKIECYCGDNSVSCRLNWLGEKLCFCKKGYDQRGGTEICSRTCQSNADCRNDGICDRDGFGYFCVCPGTFIGDRCEVDVCNSVRFVCRSLGAECVRQGTIGVCECPRGKKMSPYNYCEDICSYETCVYGTCELTGHDFSQYVCNCYEGYYGRHCENALVVQYTPAISLIVILASGILLFSITSIVAGCWVKRLRKKIAEKSKQTGQP